MASEPKNPKNSNGNTSSFKIDEPSHLTEMPSITRLLNRRSLKLGSESNQNSDGNTSLFKRSAGESAQSAPTPQEEPRGVVAPPPPPPPPSTQSADFVLLEAVPADPVSTAGSGIELAPALELAPQAPEETPPSPTDGVSIAIEAPALEIELSASAPASVLEEPSAEPSAETGGIEVVVEPEPSVAISAPAPYEPTPVGEIPVPEEATETKNSAPKLKVQPSSRKAKQKPPLQLWDLDRLKQSSDPMGEVLLELFGKRHITSALFLSIAPPPGGSQLPHFVAHAAARAELKLPFWTGLRWDPTLIPEMWNHFVKSGMLELSPPGTVTNLKSNRNVIRGAFGIVQSEWLTLVRVGPANACRGVLVLVSMRPISPIVQNLLPQLATAPKAAA